jgi:hypothetical protein
MFIPHCSLYGHLKVQIRYFRNQAGLFEVKALHDGKSIVVFPATMRRVLGIDPRTSVGCAEITGLQADKLGFVVPKRKQDQKVAV